MITRHGKREAVLLSYEQWQRLSQVPSFGRLLMSAPLGEARGRGHTTAFADVAIAATAQHHNLAILTCNLKHYIPLGVAAHDRVTELPAGMTPPRVAHAP